MSKYEFAGASETAPQSAASTPVVCHDALASHQPGYVAGVDIGGTNLRVALADLSGNIVARWSSSTVGLRGPEQVVQRVCSGVRDMLQQVAARPGALQSIAIGVPGVADIDNGIVIATSYLMGWRDVPLRALVENELNVPAAVDNDVNMAAIGECWAGSARNVRDFVFLAIGTGIGAGVVLDGRPHRGTCWAAGEIGYMLVPGVTGGPGKSHEPGALESMIGGEGIRDQWQKLWDPQKTALPEELNATEIFDRAVDGDRLAHTILEQSATMLAHAIYNVALVLNCPLFVLGGSVGMHPALGDATQKLLEQWHVRGGLRLAPSSLGAEAQLLGAVRTALDTAAAFAVLPPASAS